MDPEERDEQQRGSSKPPGNTCMDQGVSWHRSQHSNETGLGPMSRGHSQVNTGLIPTNVGGLKFLYKNDDDADEEHKVDLQETKVRTEETDGDGFLPPPVGPHTHHSSHHYRSQHRSFNHPPDGSIVVHVPTSAPQKKTRLTLPHTAGLLGPVLEGRRPAGTPVLPGKTTFHLGSHLVGQKAGRRPSRTASGHPDVEHTVIPRWRPESQNNMFLPPLMK